MTESWFYHISQAGKLSHVTTVDAALAEVKDGGFVWLYYCQTTKEELSNLILGINGLGTERLTNVNTVSITAQLGVLQGVSRTSRKWLYPRASPTSSKHDQPLQQVDTNGSLLDFHLHMPAGAHCLATLPQTFAHIWHMLPDSYPGRCRPKT